MRTWRSNRFKNHFRMVPPLLLLLIQVAATLPQQAWRPRWGQPQGQVAVTPWRQQPLQVTTRINTGPYEVPQQRDQSGTWFEGGVPQTPCPEVFTYEHEGGEWVGVARVNPPINSAVSNQTIRLQVALTVETLLTTKYAGKVELREGKSVVVARLREGGGDPIEYRVRFPVQSPLPKLNAIKVNGRTLCEDNPAVADVHTTLTLGHTLYAYVNFLWYSSTPTPPRVSHEVYVPSRPPPQTYATPPPSRPPPNVYTTPPTTRAPPKVYATQAPPRPPPDVPNGSPPRNSPLPTLPSRIITDTTQETDRNEDCGVIINLLPLVLGGSDVTERAWPWLVAMFAKTNVGLDFQCGGSLVSASHVVTAAHCVKPPYKDQLSPRMIVLYMGKHNLLNWTEPFSQSREVENIVIHPNYEGSSEKTDSDLAVLVLAVPVTFTRSVRPVCLWRNGAQVADSQGTVVGWGKRDNLPGHRVSDVPQQVRMPIVTQEECLRSHRNFYYLTSENTYCAGGREGSGPCNGDSGGGMYFPEKMADGSTRWMLRGVVSLSLQDENMGCDLLNYVVFTDVARFATWISDVMARGRNKRRTRP